MKMFKGDTVISGFQWLPDQGTNMTVLHVASKTMKRFRCAENFFAFHTVNTVSYTHLTLPTKRIV